MMQIKLVKRVPVKSGSGNWGPDTETVYKFWGEPVKQSGTRIYINGQSQMEDSLRFRVRFRPDFDLSGDWKIIYQGKSHTVTSITREKEKRFFWIINANSSGKI